MALVQNVQIARDKYASQSQQARLHADVQQQAQTVAELNKARATQRAMEAQLGRQQAVHGQQIAQAQFEYEGQEYEERKIAVLLQAFTALSKIFHNITYTAAIIMGFSAGIFVKEKINYAAKTTKFVFWGLAMTTIVLFVHAVFVASLAIIDGTKLAYQGTKGQEDVKRAFHGLMARRSEVFWNYMAGFLAFLVLLIYAVWAKLDQDSGPGGKLTTGNFIYGGTLSFVAWLVPLGRMIHAHRTTRQAFQIDYKGATADVGQAQAVERLAQNLDLADAFARDLGPQSLRKREDARHPRGGRLGPDASSASVQSPVSGEHFKSFQGTSRSGSVQGGGPGPAEGGGRWGGSIVN